MRVDVGEDIRPKVNSSSMSPLQILAAAVMGALFGVVAWRRATKRLHYRSPNPTIRPAHVSQKQYDAAVMARRRRVRLARTAAAVLAGALLGWIAATMLAAGLTRR